MIKATIIADSVSESGQRITTFVLEYHRYVHSELMTHRMFSRNSSSTRAIPLSAASEQVMENPAIPIHWGKKQRGMQANEECNNPVQLGLHYGAAREVSREEAWWHGMNTMLDIVKGYDEAGYHKQFAGRALETFQMMRVQVTATCFENWFWLRNDSAAQPEIKELAQCMLEAMNRSEPELLKEGEWHTPWVDHYRSQQTGELVYMIEEDGVKVPLTLEQAQLVSSARSAAISYRKDGLYGLEKSKEVFGNLIDSERVHGSALEHCATPIARTYDFYQDWPDGASHMDRKGNLWSGNFCNWIQYRKLIPNEYKAG